MCEKERFKTYIDTPPLRPHVEEKRKVTNVYGRLFMDLKTTNAKSPVSDLEYTSESGMLFLVGEKL